MAGWENVTVQRQ